ncbi:MAG: N-acetylmuramic acid 6-phosphate etherase [Planctomycetaceae bacterium]|nr:N-acetylmuramic acid 6-phosphate etherase [Planctomycetaceae bacterium]
MQTPLPSLAATEARNSATSEIDRLSPLQIAAVMAAEDAKVAAAVAAEKMAIGRAIDGITERMQAGGRLIYQGAGTSGRLGVLDASECPPTFSVPHGLVIGVIAGGRDALTNAIEGAEDNRAAGAQDLAALNLTSLDTVVGIATSGRTPYVLGGIEYARRTGCLTIGIACNEGSILGQMVDIMIAPIVGPEVITGSTRLKAGTATKLVLNMLSTGTMIRLGKTYGNLMVDLRASNEKLKDRSIRIVAELTGLDKSSASELLGRCNSEVKTAIVTHKRSVTPDEARSLLAAGKQQLRAALEAT